MQCDETSQSTMFSADLQVMSNRLPRKFALSLTPISGNLRISSGIVGSVNTVLQYLAARNIGYGGGRSSGGGRGGIVLNRKLA